jgi:NAD(P)-dependent dehydrogenase (short-subunit alcohol dehydrogenase family)
LAPYLLTEWIERPSRLIYISSDMHASGDTSLQDLDWMRKRWNGVQAYCDSKLFVTTLAFALRRRWPEVHVNAVDPGWVPTWMGGAGAPDDLELGTRLRPGSPSATTRPRQRAAATGTTAGAIRPPRRSSTNSSKTRCSTSSCTSRAYVCPEHRRWITDDV